MSRLLFDAFDVSGIGVTVSGTAAAQVSAATLRAVTRVLVAGTASPQLTAAGLAVTGSGVLSHSEAPSPRRFLAQRGGSSYTAPLKDTNEILDYSIVWTDVLAAGEAIASSVWNVAGVDLLLTIGVSERAHTFGVNSTTLWLLAGTVGATYRLTNHITTSHSPPREYERSFSLKVSDL